MEITMGLTLELDTRTVTGVNPILKSDYPDPDVIRVGKTYYMISTTMYFMPGGVILRSYDLVNWEIVSYVYDTLDDSEEERLENGKNEYGKGMWAPTLRYSNGTFYVAFVSHGKNFTHLFTATDIEGPWEHKRISGYYHDCSLLFDDDGRVYIAYGNTDITVTELLPDLSGPKPGGESRVVLSDSREAVTLGYEGTHFYKINGRYYLFMIHWPKSTGLRTEAVFVSDSPTGEYTGRDVCADTLGFKDGGCAQGGIVDTPNGTYYSIVFRDWGAVGRIPVLIPVSFSDGFPIFGDNGCIPESFSVPNGDLLHNYEPLYTNDSFHYDSEHPVLKLQWQFNHAPDNALWRILDDGGFAIKTDRICRNVTQAKNTLTQRMMYPGCEAYVTVDASLLNNGDIAGICALSGKYALLGILKESDRYYMVKIVKQTAATGFSIGSNDTAPGTLLKKSQQSGPLATLCLTADFRDGKDKLDFFVIEDNNPTRIGDSHRLEFRLDHFTGARFGLFTYSTQKFGGEGVFRHFRYMAD